MPDLSAHRTLIDLAQGTDGKTRIVTTNFDLLFEACDPTLPSFSPPKLPDPRRYNDLHGVTHLHGAVSERMAGACRKPSCTARRSRPPCARNVCFSFETLLFDRSRLDRVYILVKLGGTERDLDAFWSGYFWSATVPQPSLYRRLKPALLALATGAPHTKRSNSIELAGILLAGWGSRDDEGKFLDGQRNEIYHREGN